MIGVAETELLNWRAFVVAFCRYKLQAKVQLPQNTNPFENLPNAVSTEDVEGAVTVGTSSRL